MIDETIVSLGTKEHPWTTGETNGFKISTYIEPDEREIDVDDNGAVLNVEIEILRNKWNLVGSIQKATLEYDFSSEHITLAGAGLSQIGTPNKGSIELMQANTILTPGKPQLVQLTVKTGYWGSETPNTDLGETPAGPKHAKVILEYEFQHATANNMNSEDAVMLLYIARD